MEQKDIQLFNFNQSKVTVIIDEHGEPWWIAKEVCEILELSNPTAAVQSLDDDEKNTLRIFEGIRKRGNPNKIIVNEPGLYTLILRSTKPQAKVFRRWITHEVLPQIRKTGGYIPIRPEEPVKVFLSRAFEVAHATIAEYAQQIEQHRMLRGSRNENRRPCCRQVFQAG